jgi:hypothetical protein
MCIRELYILFVNYNRGRLTLYLCEKNILNAPLFYKKNIFKTITRIIRFCKKILKIEQQ